MPSLLEEYLAAMHKLSDAKEIGKDTLDDEAHCCKQKLFRCNMDKEAIVLKAAMLPACNKWNVIKLARSCMEFVSANNKSGRSWRQQRRCQMKRASAACSLERGRDEARNPAEWAQDIFYGVTIHFIIPEAVHTRGNESYP
jgi:hypothetical protein